MKRMISILVAVMMVVGIAGTASAAFVEGDFYLGFVGTDTEVSADLGVAMTTGTTSDLFSTDDLLNQDTYAGTVFNGISIASEIVIDNSGIFPKNVYVYDVYLAVESGTSPQTISNMGSSIYGSLLTAMSYHTSDVMANSTDGFYGQLSPQAQMGGYFTGTNYAGELAALDSNGVVEMDIWHLVNYDGEWTVVEDSGLNLEVGLADGAVYAKVVPVPGALLLLGSGLMALIGVRRRRNA